MTSRNDRTMRRLRTNAAHEDDDDDKEGIFSIAVVRMRTQFLTSILRSRQFVVMEATRSNQWWPT